ncbi:GntP family permease [Alkalilimnicola ehrlichii]|uniref:GntP family permease n=1 Tax=Alkalilimnicola ehrlichii TaxID=351052 RepID=UPI003BA37124
MGSTADFIALYFPVFLLGAVFGKLMEDSGSAEVLANAIIERLGSNRAILAVVLSCAVMTYGGVSLFVVAFAVFPIAAALFRQADIPKRLIPATIALGAFTFTMTALPGTPAIQNAIPMPYFGTSPFAAPGLGVITAAVMFSLGMLWLQYRARKLAKEGYGDHDDAEFTPDKALCERAAGEGSDLMELPVKQQPVGPPPILIAVLPLVLVIAINLVFTFLVIPRMDTDYLALPIYGETSIDQVRGIWSVIAALVLSLLVLIATNWRRLTGLKQSVDNGANASLLPIFNTASLVGFGAVIASLGAFLLIRDHGGALRLARGPDYPGHPVREFLIRG